MSRLWRRFHFRWVLYALLVLAGTATTLGAIWYHRFNHHVTPQEVSHEVVHSMFDARVRDSSVKLHLYQQANAKGQQLVFFTSGDGGWSPFCADIAAHIAATGRTVVGFNANEYLTTFASSQKPATPEELIRDYSSLIDAAETRDGIDTKGPIILSGWSLGAGFSVLVGTDNSLKNRLNRIVAISLPNYNELAWKPSDSVIYITHGIPHEKVFQAQEYLGKLTPVPLVMLNATSDDTVPLADARSLFEKATGPRKLFTIAATGHHFEGGEQEFYRDLDEGLSSPKVN